MWWDVGGVVMEALGVVGCRGCGHGGTTCISWGQLMVKGVIKGVVMGVVMGGRGGKI